MKKLIIPFLLSGLIFTAGTDRISPGCTERGYYFGHSEQSCNNKKGFGII